MNTLKDFREYRKTNSPQEIEFYRLLDLYIQAMNGNAGLGVITGIRAEVLLWLRELSMDHNIVDTYVKDRVKQ